MLLGFRIEALVALGRTAEARTHLPELIGALAQPSAPHYDLEAWTGAGLAALALGEDETARQCANEALGLARQFGRFDHLTGALRYRRRVARLAERVGLAID
jgi:hypothetical protein